MTSYPNHPFCWRIFCLAGLAGLIPSCTTVGRDYQAPVLTVPASWHNAALATARDDALLAQWWRQFGDLTLDRLVSEALAANTDLATARARLQEARARREFTQAERGLAITASGTTRYTQGSVATGSNDSYHAELTARWEPDLFGGSRQGLEAAEADTQASAEALFDTRVNLVAEVARTYVQLRTNEQRLVCAEANLAAQTASYQLTLWRQQAGLVPALDVAQARTQQAQTRAGLPVLRTNIATAHHRLASLLAKPPGELLLLVGAGSKIPVSPINAVGIPADTLRQRPDVRAAERRLAAQTARLGEAEAARYPRLNLTGSLGLDALAANRLLRSSASTGSLLASISAPIFDAGRIRANITIQDALLEQSRLAYQAAVLTALEAVENALVTLSNARQRQVELTQAAASAQETLTLAQQRYSAVLSDFQPVLESQRTLLTLEDQLASAKGDASNAQILLYQALGGGWDPSAHQETP